MVLYLLSWQRGCICADHLNPKAQSQDDYFVYTVIGTTSALQLSDSAL